MRFTGPEAVTDPFGPKPIDPLHARGNWSATRLHPVDLVGGGVEHLAERRQGTVSSEAETSGMAVFAHELSHNLGLPDNYNNPFAAVPQRPRAACGSMMSRGSFNGPGGPHTRWQIPPTPGRRARRAAQHPQQAAAELRRGRRRAGAQPQRPGPDRHRWSPRSRRARSTRAMTSPVSASCSTTAATRTRSAATRSTRCAKALVLHPERRRADLARLRRLHPSRSSSRSARTPSRVARAC